MHMNEFLDGSDKAREEWFNKEVLPHIDEDKINFIKSLVNIAWSNGLQYAVMNVNNVDNFK